MKVFRLSALSRSLVRCVECAGPPPDPLPDLPMDLPVSERMSRIGMQPVKSAAPKTRGQLKALAREWSPLKEDDR